MTEKDRSLRESVRHLSNLALPELGGAIHSVSDEFFAAAKRMLSAGDPVFKPGCFDQHGKWMDGWESRRKRVTGHDFCVVRICPGVIRAVEIDTSYFTGNFPPFVMLEACSVQIEPDERTEWTVLIAKTEIEGDSVRLFPVRNENTWSHVRLNIYPDGGIARLRVFGEPLRHESAAEQGSVG